MKKIIVSLSVILVLSSCSDDKFSAVKQFMREADEKARNIRVDEPPIFEAYKPFSYAGANKRSPFQKPVSIEDALRNMASSDVAPNEERPKEFLEQFDINLLQYVGLLAQGSSVWALIRDPEKRVHRIKAGNYLGKDHGRVQTINEEQVIVLEIVPNGLSSWIERPHNMDLQGK